MSIRPKKGKHTVERDEILADSRKRYASALDAVFVESSDLGNIYVIVDEFSNALCEAWYDSTGRYHSRPTGYDPHNNRSQSIS